jgi:hypothetical protein
MLNLNNLKHTYFYKNTPLPVKIEDKAFWLMSTCTLVVGVKAEIMDGQQKKILFVVDEGKLISLPPMMFIEQRHKTKYKIVNFLLDKIFPPIKFLRQPYISEVLEISGFKTDKDYLLIYQDEGEKK